MMATISVVIPTHNRAALLPRAIRSVLEQTRPPDEIIVVDDASTDETSHFLEQFSQVTLLRRQHQGGAGVARNTGAQHARGEFLAFLDSDDVWTESKLEKQLEHMRGAVDLDLLCCGMTVHNRSGVVVQHCTVPSRSSHLWTFDEYQNYIFCPSNWLVRREAFIAAGMFDTTLPNCEDLDLLARMSGQWKIAVLPEALTLKFNQADSLDTDLMRTAQSYEMLFARHTEMWKRAPGAAVRGYERLARMHIRAGATHAARKALISALRYRPLGFRTWAKLIALTVGADRHNAVARKHARPAEK
jgi:glycosyltransferase involved in cell wall biosynthesis